MSVLYLSPWSAHYTRDMSMHARLHRCFYSPKLAYSAPAHMLLCNFTFWGMISFCRSERLRKGNWRVVQTHWGALRFVFWNVRCQAHKKQRLRGGGARATSLRTGQGFLLVWSGLEDALRWELSCFTCLFISFPSDLSNLCVAAEIEEGFWFIKTLRPLTALALN